MLNNLKKVIVDMKDLKSGTGDKKKIVKVLKTVKAQLDKSAQRANKVSKVTLVPIKSIVDAFKALKGADKAWLCNPKNQKGIWEDQMVKRSKKISSGLNYSLNLLADNYTEYNNQTLLIAKDMSIVATIMEQGAKDLDKPTATVSPLVDKNLQPRADKLYKSAEKLRKLLKNLDKGRVSLSKTDDALKTFIKETKAEAKKKKKRLNWFTKVVELADSVDVLLKKSMVAMKFAEDEFNAADLW
ncbi:MAG: hypothetical protein IH891_04730 [Planctomycetes bacterium]|nr:hypothetical protein [Planctomycetota bacterium]